jgi:hypothetical protein
MTMTLNEALHQAIDDFNMRTECALQKWSDIYIGQPLIVISDKPLAMKGIEPLPVLSMIDGGTLGKRYIVLKSDLEKHVWDD